MLLRLCALALAFAVTFGSAAIAQSVEDVELVQELLEDYDAGDEDGIVGPITMGAVRGYQKDWNIKITGEITPDLIKMLERKHATTMPRWTKVSNLDCEVWTRFPQAREIVTWSGGCENGKIAGNGTLVRNYVRVRKTYDESYIGDYVAGKRTGRGIMKFAGGDQYDGEFKDDLKDGRGVYTFADGDKYDGEYTNGTRNGQGVYVYADGDRYEGAFREGEESGMGVYIHADGDKYEGEFAGGTENGRGVMFFSDGGRFEGTFSKGAAHGRGIFTTAKGERELREFDKGCSPGSKDDLVIGADEADCKFE